MDSKEFVVMLKLILWPFRIIIDLVTFIIGITGKLIGSVIGLVIMILGMIFTVTLVGAIIGIPIIIFGFLIMIKAIF